MGQPHCRRTCFLSTSDAARTCHNRQRSSAQSWRNSMAQLWKHKTGKMIDFPTVTNSFPKLASLSNCFQTTLTTFTAILARSCPKKPSSLIEGVRPKTNHNKRDWECRHSHACPSLLKRVRKLEPRTEKHRQHPSASITLATLIYIFIYIHIYIYTNLYILYIYTDVNIYIYI